LSGEDKKSNAEQSIQEKKQEVENEDKKIDSFAHLKSVKIVNHRPNFICTGKSLQIRVKINNKNDIH